MLISSLVLWYLKGHEFFDGKIPDLKTLLTNGSPEHHFIIDQKYLDDAFGITENCVKYFMCNHVACIILSYWADYCKINGSQMGSSLLNSAKFAINLLTVIYGEEWYVELRKLEERHSKTSLVRVWLYHEVMIFYFNILAIAVFMAIAWLSKYKTIRERLGLQHETGPLSRKESDFMAYCQNDMTLFTNRFIITCLTIAALYYRIDDISMNYTFGIFLCRHFLFMSAMGSRMFSDEFDTNFSLLEKFIISISFLANFFLMYRFHVHFEDENYNVVLPWLSIEMIEIVFSILYTFQLLAYSYGFPLMLKLWRKQMRQEIISKSLQTIEE